MDLIERIIEISKNSDVSKAIELQKELYGQITMEDGFSSVKSIAGIDLAYSGEFCYCAIIVLDAGTLKVTEESYSKEKITFPYIPGLLFFREFPAFYKAYLKLTVKPDILLFDGQGLSHQRMMGIATMAGILIDKPTIGCAKSHLYGDFHIPENKKYAYSPLSIKNMTIGYVLRSRENIKPIFISTGYKVSPSSSLEIVKKLITNYKLPLPTHLAHKACENYKNTHS